MLENAVGDHQKLTHTGGQSRLPAKPAVSKTVLERLAQGIPAGDGANRLLSDGDRTYTNNKNNTLMATGG